MTRRLLRRWPVLFLGLAAAGCGGGSGSGSSGSGFAPSPSDTGRGAIILARVGDKVIPAAAVVQHMETMQGPERGRQAAQNPDMLHVALDALLDQYVWAAKAESEGFRLTLAEQAEVDDLATRLLATRYLGDVVDKKANPTREMVEAWYNDNQENYLRPPAVGVRHILVGSRAQAEALRKQVEGGAVFADLARAHSQDPATRDIGGALGMIKPGEKILGFPGDGRNSAFESAALPLEEGQLAIVETLRGWHLIRCEKREGGGLRPLEEVYDDIAKAMARRDFPRIYNEDLLAAREEFGAEIVAEGFEQFTGVSRNIERIMGMAEAHPDAGGRIELYRRVVFDFPNSDQAPYAQFMIGYLQLTALNDSYSARKALNRLGARYADSEWSIAGKYLSQFLDPNMTQPGSGHAHPHEGEQPAPVPIDLGGPQDVLRKAKAAN